MDRDNSEKRKQKYVNKQRETFGLCPHCQKPIKLVEDARGWLWNFEKGAEK